MEQSAKYAYIIYENKSFSAAAKSLFISQPALSQSITRLEKDLGFAIFDRKTNPMSLTPEGAIYIDSLEEIIESERIMKERIKRLSNMEHGKVTVGGSCLASYHILAAASAEFHKKYPDIYIDIDMGNAGTNLIEKAKKHSLDIFIGHSFSEKDFSVTPILEERYVVAMKTELAIKHGLLPYSVTAQELISESYPTEKEIEDMSIFKGVEFLGIGKNSTTAKKLQQLLGEYTLSKCSVRNVRHAGMQYNLMRFGMGAIMTSNTIVKMFSSDASNIVFFVPKSEKSKQFLYAAYDITQKPTLAAQKFLSLTKELCQSGRIFQQIIP